MYACTVAVVYILETFYFFLVMIVHPQIALRALTRRKCHFSDSHYSYMLVLQLYLSIFNRVTHTALIVKICITYYYAACVQLAQGGTIPTYVLYAYQNFVNKTSKQLPRSIAIQLAAAAAVLLIQLNYSHQVRSISEFICFIVYYGTTLTDLLTGWCRESVAVYSRYATSSTSLFKYTVRYVTAVNSQ